MNFTKLEDKKWLKIQIWENSITQSKLKYVHQINQLCQLIIWPQT